MMQVVCLCKIFRDVCELGKGTLAEYGGGKSHCASTAQASFFNNLRYPSPDLLPPKGATDLGPNHLCHVACWWPYRVATEIWESNFVHLPEVINCLETDLC